jgi:DNA-directed RNA polymerase beta subunit
MEVTAFHANGATGVVQDRMMHASDEISMTLCARCGRPTLPDAAVGAAKVCTSSQCRDTQNFVVTEVPSVLNHMSKVLKAMGIEIIYSSLAQNLSWPSLGGYNGV